MAIPNSPSDSSGKFECERSRNSTDTPKAAEKQSQPTRSEMPRSAAHPIQRHKRIPTDRAILQTRQRTAIRSSWASKAAARATSHTERARRFVRMMLMMSRHPSGVRMIRFGVLYWSPSLVRRRMVVASVLLIKWWLCRFC